MVLLLKSKLARENEVVETGETIFDIYWVNKSLPKECIHVA